MTPPDEYSAVRSAVQELPDKWRWTELGDLLSGVTLRARDMPEGSDLPVLSLTKDRGLILQSKRFDHRVATEDVTDYKVVKPEWIAYNPMVLWEGAIWANRRDVAGLVSPAYAIWEATGVDWRFVDFLLRSPMVLAEYERLCSGVVKRRRTVSRGQFRSISVPIPPQIEQSNIAKVLDAVRQSLMASVDVAEAARSVKASLLEAFLARDWRVERLGDFVEKPQYGYTASAQDEPVGPRFLRITDIQDGRVRWAGVPYCECSEDERQKFAVSEGDILVARIGATTGKACLVREVPESTVFASYLIRLKCRESLSPLYLDRYMDSRHYWNQINSEKGGRLKAGVNASTLRELSIPVPPLQEQERIAGQLATIEAKIMSEIQTQQALEALFDSLRHALMTGRTSVPGNRTLESPA